MRVKLGWLTAALFALGVAGGCAGTSPTKLNGRSLQLLADDVFPSLDAVRIDAGGVELAPASITFSRSATPGTRNAGSASRAECFER